jgi:glycine dehydrogenase subunit 1
MRYIPHTEADIRSMLETIGVPSVDALFSSIPSALQLNRPLEVPSAMAEPDVRGHLVALADANTSMGRAKASFLGGGVYRHYAPVAVSQLLLRGEIYTAYTPYQPEIAQGTLQIIFEFQTMVSELLGIEVVNASMYDGSTSLAEAALMALRLLRDKSDRVIVSRALHPEWREVTRMNVENTGAKTVDVPFGRDGRTDLAAVERELQEGACAVCLGYPTFLGTFDDLAAARALCDKYGALLIASFTEATAFGLVTPPGELGADIIVGEGQSLGVPASLGGPHLGLFGTREKYLRQMPGRLAGETVDVRGNRGFVLTMSTREQHIRREKATSNICTNVALMATCSTIAMTLLGPNGLATVARASHLRAEEAKARLCALPGFSLYFDSPTYNEFVLRTPKLASHYVDALAGEQIGAGIALGAYVRELGEPGLEHGLLIAATELTTSEAIDALVEGLARV